LRGQTAVDKAKADAFAQLLPAQMQAALQNQATGVNAGTALGQVGSQGTTSMLGLGQAQQSDPFMSASNLGKIVGGIQAPTTVQNTTQLSPLNTLGSLLSAGYGGYNAINSATGGALGSLFGNLFNRNNSGNSGIQYDSNGAVINSTVPSNYTQTTGADQGYNQVDNSGQAIY
jgi:hypothetical protein